MGSPCPTHVIQSRMAASLHRDAPPEIEDIGQGRRTGVLLSPPTDRSKASRHTSPVRLHRRLTLRSTPRRRVLAPNQPPFSRYPTRRASSSTMSGSLNRCCLALRQKLSLEFIQDLANLAAQGIVQLLLLSDLLPQSRIGGVQEVVEPLLERPAVFDGEAVQITVRPGENNNHLFLHRPRLVLVLLQNLGQAAPAAELRLRGLVQVLTAKLRKGREL